MASKGRIVVVGGHGKVSLRFTKLASQAGYQVISIIRNPEQVDDIKAVGGEPLVLSIEASTVSDLTPHFTGAISVVFSCGAGGKGGEERTKAVDYDGALKVFDAIEAIPGGKESRPRFLMVSAIDLRDKGKGVPSHYNDDDVAVSDRYWGAIPTYMKWKREADLELTKRTGFNWFILRPTGLTDNPGSGKITVGRTHLQPIISREDVAATLLEILSHPEVNGIGLDLIGGETPISEGVKAALEKKETSLIN